MYKVNVKERIKGLEEARKNSYGMTATCYSMQLAVYYVKQGRKIKNV